MGQINDTTKGRNGKHLNYEERIKIEALHKAGLSPNGIGKQVERKLLLCHHPEYYPKFLKKYNIDLVLSGHSHGGQWRFFGRGVYAPGQGWLPKLTDGVHYGKLVISRGLGNVVKVPRIFNNPETVIIDINAK